MTYFSFAAHTFEVILLIYVLCNASFTYENRKSAVICINCKGEIKLCNGFSADVGEIFTCLTFRLAAEINVIMQTKLFSKGTRIRCYENYERKYILYISKYLYHVVG